MSGFQKLDDEAEVRKAKEEEKEKEEGYKKCCTNEWLINWGFRVICFNKWPCIFLSCIFRKNFSDFWSWHAFRKIVSDFGGSLAFQWKWKLRGFVWISKIDCEFQQYVSECWTICFRMSTINICPIVWIKSFHTTYIDIILIHMLQGHKDRDGTKNEFMCAIPLLVALFRIIIIKIKSDY